MIYTPVTVNPQHSDNRDSDSAIICHPRDSVHQQISWYGGDISFNTVLIMLF